MAHTEQKRTGPSRNKYLQQTNKVHQLVLSPKCVITTLFLIGIIFVVIGIILLGIESSVTQIRQTYSPSCPDVDSKSCKVTFKLDNEIKGPVFFYYTLSKYYQNHRRYVPSKSDIMARGDFGDETLGDDPVSSKFTKCTNADVAYTIGGKNVYYYPCGLVPRSLFNDTFTLRDDQGAVVDWTANSITVEGADDKFQSKGEEWLRERCYSLGEFDLNDGRPFELSGFSESLRGFAGTRDISKSRYHCWHNITDPDLIVWTRTAVAPSFWKQYRIIEKDLPAGDYELEIDLRYSVQKFGCEKGFVLSNATPVGASRNVISVVYLVVGVVSLVLAIVFLIMAIVLPLGKKPEIRYPPAVVKPMKEKHHSKHSCLPSHVPKIHAHHIEAQRIVRTPHSHKNNQAHPGHPTDEAHKHEAHQHFANNFVSTTKYTALTFLPKNLYIQFQRFANIYFLGIACLASFPVISPLGGSTFWFPLCLVLCFTGLKDANEDYRRHKSDIEENNRTTEIFDEETKNFVKVPWSEVKVGSIVRVTTCDPDCSPLIPSDLALLATSSEDGTCFLETANLDGETNLKLREAPENVHEMLTKKVQTLEGNTAMEIVLEEVAKFESQIFCHQPDVLLYDFNAHMEVNGQELPLSGGSSGGQFMQRSTKLKNSKWFVGVAVYTGKETKIQMNMNEPPNKISNIERSLNVFIVFLFVALLIICLICAIGAGVFATSNDAKESWYLAPDKPGVTFDVENGAKTGFFSMLSFLILLSLLIPISLYVSVEFVKAFIMWIISSDRKMYVESEDLASKARSAGLCEELGQVNYIFSDKTGTLTQNLMEFKKCSIGGVEYGHGFCEVEHAIARRKGQVLPPEQPPPPGLDEGFNFWDERLLFSKWREQPQHEMIEKFMENLALNHTVQVEYVAGNTSKPMFQAESPDEGAFVTAARNFGFFFCKRVMREITCKVSNGAVGEGIDKVWTQLATNAFDNTRKRTSIVVRDDQGKTWLLVKGADTSVMPFITNDCPYFDATQTSIDKFGDQGLRTLVFAGRELMKEEFEPWFAAFQKAAMLAQNREETLQQLASMIEEGHSEDNRDSALVDSSTPYEQKLVLHGVTALEDKLQENVGDCIAQLAKAMIKIWVLTGDKVETAINIGYAAALLLTEMEPLLRISRDDLESPDDGWRATATPLELVLNDAIDLAVQKDAQRIVELLDKHQSVEGGYDIIPVISTMAKQVTERRDRSVTQVGADLSVMEAKLRERLLRERVRKQLQSYEAKTAEHRPGGHALVIDGACLRAAMHTDTKITFLKVSVRCKAVLCCRVTPSQKADVTLLVKENMPGQITLAIGDGANDVSMIQAAHIGVGIRGKEGQQAVLASDYALPRFAYLERLLLIHGRWSYNRMGTMVCYFFYKNITFALTLFWFAFSNGFSAQALYDDGYQSLYNVVFTSLPVMTFAVLDRDMEDAVVSAHPELYSTGQWNQKFSSRRFGTFIMGSVVHSLMLFFVMVEALDLNASDVDGTGIGIWSVGTVVLTGVIITVNVVIGVHTRSWTWIHMLFYGGSVLVWFLFLLLYHSLKPGFFLMFDSTDNIYYLFQGLAKDLLFWLVVWGLVAMCCVPILAYKYCTETYFPNIDDYYRRVVANPGKYPNEHTQVELQQAPVEEANATNDATEVQTEFDPVEPIQASEYSSESAKSAVPNDLPRFQQAGKELIRRNRKIRHHGQSRSDYTPPAVRTSSARTLSLRHLQGGIVTNWEDNNVHPTAPHVNGYITHQEDFLQSMSLGSLIQAESKSPVNGSAVEQVRNIPGEVSSTGLIEMGVDSMES